MQQAAARPDASLAAGEREFSALVDAFILRVKADHLAAPLSPRDRAMIDYAVRLTRNPGSMTRADVDALRAQAFEDATIHDITQVVALFSYYNRLADGLGIDPEPEHLHGDGPRPSLQP